MKKSRWTVALSIFAFFICFVGLLSFTLHIMALRELPAMQAGHIYTYATEGRFCLTDMWLPQASTKILKVALKDQQLIVTYKCVFPRSGLRQ